ncbi:MAG: hypothetical protein ACI89G_002797, partial [Minisyncoccia bacterium]
RQRELVGRNRLVAVIELGSRDGQAESGGLTRRRFDNDHEPL